MITKLTGTSWEVTGQSEAGRYITVKADTGRTVARVPWNKESTHYTACTDNNDAILIAHAPELLAMIEKLIDNDYRIGIPPEILEKLGDTFKRATGRIGTL